MTRSFVLCLRIPGAVPLDGDVRRAIELVGDVTDRPATRERPRSGPGNHAIRATPEVWAQIITEERFDSVNCVRFARSPNSLNGSAAR